MPFMQAPTGGDFTTYIRYDARSGRWATKEEGPDKDLYEVENMTAIWDLAHIKTAWIRYPAGMAPEKVLDPSLTQAAPKPHEEAKRGFVVMLFSDKNIGGKREFTSTAGVVINAVNDLYDSWEAAPEKDAGKLPVVKCTGVTAVKSAKSTNYQPKLAIVGWADRPAELSEEQVNKAAANPAIEKAQAQRQAAKTATAPAEEELDDAVVF